MRIQQHWNMILAMPSGPSALYGLRLLIISISCSWVMLVHFSAGNRAWARILLFSLFVVAWMTCLSGPVLHRVGIHVLPSSPPRFDRYLCTPYFGACHSVKPVFPMGFFHLLYFFAK